MQGGWTRRRRHDKRVARGFEWRHGVTPRSGAVRRGRSELASPPPCPLAFASGDGDVFRVAAAARRRLPYVVLCKVWEATSCSMRARKFRAGCGHTPSIDCAESLRQSEQNLASDLLNFSFIH